MPESPSNPLPTTDPLTTLSPTDSVNQIYDVVIVGAGPIGLATAIGLRQRGVNNILVIDRTRAFRPAGQAVDLLPNGLKALKCLDPDAYEAVQPVAFRGTHVASSRNENMAPATPEVATPAKPAPRWVQRNLQGQEIRAIPLGFDDWFKEYGEGRVSIAWYELQTRLRDLLPSDRVQPNCRCINLVDEPELGCVRVDYVSSPSQEANPYAHWDEGKEAQESPIENLETVSQQLEIKSVRAKLVVGADGINSTVRQVIYKDGPYQAFGKPEYSGFAGIICLEIATLPEPLVREVEETFFQGSSIVTISPDSRSGYGTQQSLENPRIILIRRLSSQLGCLINIPVSLTTLQGKSGSELIVLTLEILEKAGFPDVIQQVVKQVVPETIQQRLYYIHRATLSDSLPFPSTACLNLSDLPSGNQPDWYVGRVVLVGDAAHGMPPFAGQGANQGLEDALIVATSIAQLARQNRWDDTVAIAQAFEKYQSLRRPFMVDIQEATLRRVSYSSEEEWNSYNQKVFCRDFEPI